MRIIITVDDGSDEIIEIRPEAFVPRGKSDGEVEVLKREAREQLAADLRERAPEAAKAIDQLLAERAKAAQAGDAVAAEAAVAELAPVKR